MLNLKSAVMKAQFVKYIIRVRKRHLWISSFLKWKHSNQGNPE